MTEGGFKVKRLLGLILCACLLAGCGGKKATALDELKSKNEELTRRVKNLEDELLAAQRKLIVHEQALQTTASRMRDMENYFNKLQVGQYPPR